MKTRSKLLGVAVLGLAAAAVYWAMRPQPVSVETVEAVKGTFEQTIDDDGKTRVRDRYVVAAPLAGRLARIALKAGDAVEQNDIVALILPSAPALQDARALRELEERAAAAQATVMRAAAMEARATAVLDQARSDAARNAKLAAEGFLSPASREQSEIAARVREQELTAARYERVTAERELAQARAALMRVRDDLRGGAAAGRGFEVRSPIGGRVLKLLQESAAPVQPGAGLLEIGDVARLEVVVDVLSTEAAAIAPGADVHLEVAAGQPSLRGKVRHVEPSAFTKISALGVEEQRVNVIVDLLQGERGAAALGDGYRVDARIVVHRADDVLLVPTGAIFREGAGFAVFVVSDGRAVKRAIDAPRRNARAAFVAGGLQAGEQVIAFPGDAVADGVRVRVRTSPPRQSP